VKGVSIVTVLAGAGRFLDVIARMHRVSPPKRTHICLQIDGLGTKKGMGDN